jgi:Tfp pilus assembly protein PilO
MNRSVLAALAVLANLSYSRVVLLTLVASAGYYFVSYNTGDEVIERIASTETEIVAERNRREETQKTLKEEEMMKANVGQTLKKFEEIKDRIPISFEERDLLEIVNQVAKQNSLSPGPRVRENNIAVESDGKDTDLVEAFGWKTTFTGSFISMAQFAIDISKLEKLIRIGNFKIVPAPAIGNGSRSGLLQMDTTIIGYRQKPLSDSENKNPSTEGKN